jgi:hypothetical protein
VEKISAARPSTAPFGNWAVLGALKRLDDRTSGARVVGTLLLGRRSRIAAEGAAAAVAAAGRRAVLPAYLGISRDDDAAAVESQWAHLRAAFLRPNACVVFHLQNHYALVFALREWEEGRAEAAAAPATVEAAEVEAAEAMDDPVKCTLSEASSNRRESSTGKLVAWRRVRQLLTSRRGQRPSAWVDFEEARQTMLGWDGYKMMLIAQVN